LFFNFFDIFSIFDNFIKIILEFEVKEDHDLLNMKFNKKLMETGFSEFKNLGKNFQDMLTGKKEKENKGKVKFAIAEKETIRQQDLH